ncbi:MAG: tRNA (guanosine(37)-N1)-methyltransferase TrmD [Holosporaceae bacterium]|jgi:tRNA (guanine37-N1)-methyltransferase|nr:tRNA (guanosine(37)-N1)-methyltransferase TrmD [Holosporaceae bacterium]
MTWRANVFTIFPDAFPGNLGVSIVGKALLEGRWQLNLIDLKRFPVKSDRIDGSPCGGGSGMILSPLVFEKAFDSLSDVDRNMRRIYFSPRGRPFRQSDLVEMANSPGITALCGRYEGVDQRILEFYSFEEVSIGDFVLLGGEAAAMVMIEGCVRLLPEVVGNGESLIHESFSDNLLEHHQYTKPRIFKELSAPEVLLSGNHQQMDEFRENQSREITRKRRPDIWAKYIAQKIGCHSEED